MESTEPRGKGQKIVPDGELVFATEENRDAVFQARRAGRLRRLGPRVYTTTLKAPDEEIVKRNWWRIAATLFPGAIIVDRTALEQKPAADGSVFLVSETRSSDFELPGIAFRPRKGTKAVVGDMPFMGRLWMSSRARAVLENMQPARERQHVRPRFTREELEQWMERQLRLGGEEALNRLRDEIGVVAPLLGLDKEAVAARRMIGAMLGTKEDLQMQSSVGRALARSEGFDVERISMFDTLRSHLAERSFETRPVRENQNFQPFFESYFSNYIEGTKFELDEAFGIVYRGELPAARPEDAHDVLGTFRIISEEPASIAKSPDDFIDLLKYKHGVLMAARPDNAPGIFKEKANMAGSTHFVRPEFVRGTLKAGFEMLQSLRDPKARAIFAMFLVSEVHPFSDGNGRIARITMNAELSAAGEERIIVPTVFRTEYLQSLKALSHNNNPKPISEVLDFAQQYTSKIDFSDYQSANLQLKETHAFEAPADAMGNGERLTLPKEKNHPKEVSGMSLGM